MLISKFDLYNPEWLELVFENRNKEYGAYDLRQHYAGNMVRAMGITFLCIGLVLGASLILKTKQAPVIQPPHDRLITVTLASHPIIVPPRPTVASTQPPAHVRTTYDPPPVVVPDPQAVNPTENHTIQGIPGQTTSPGTSVDPGPIDIAPSGSGTQPAPDISIHSTFGLDVMPEPIGGEGAWAKFLRKNLRFPTEAQDAQVSGMVTLSFVIEKDGHLSDIVVERKAGYGFDEEAARVLKLAKAWKPGMQNGQPVRVKYYIPIHFQLSD